MNIQEKIKSKGFQIAVLFVGVIFVALVSFAGGVAVGLKKARFSYKFGENYERNFGGPFRGPAGMRGPGRDPGEMMRDFEGRGFRNAHGIAGEIISITDNKIVLKDRDGQENSIAVDDKTLIKRGRDTISVNELKNDDRIVVMGKPGDDGTVSADLIRVFASNN
ncbi:MAG: hypothetical protein UX02_C0002G0232 [Candidatus Moranbacteria bacterium GW2011_GWC1_45_18]|nr:MAG: hypothetical protein UT79_C0001G0229 [Candidatus Moranbacteria bacterium GW2011_GWC2_40_12]KKT33388.1 MAG: hypothetical protein UW19_C0009G0034 [Candidatus Moranbacteria bacterium GW2011_GWF2_44_10]KKT99913.1 MAG: hypothetical protein UX02_C0002G0232 [Candidatus Moranbacteria bacterium GW2011_GWC1_45_18]OGI24030.1 MAG: hypothetical protein A2194_03565 [Candidatus Moranbacteria bacterium RIFOXYA1_FULL_44_8]OGI36922.1 MAG: hypothetical protein A2407_05320 [Candidatus Moranbacteria bacteri